MLRAYLGLLAIALSAVAIAACGSDATTHDGEAPDERLQPVPELPRGWKVETNSGGGFALGVPPGWRAARDGIRTRLSSPDELVGISVTPDRSDEPLDADLEQLTEATAIQYGRQFDDFEIKGTKRYDHQYDAFSAAAKAKDKDVGQEVELVLLRRDGIVTFTVVTQRNERFGSGVYVPTIDRVVRSIRSRPVGAG
jgi:hypothetical protein